MKNKKGFTTHHFAGFTQAPVPPRRDGAGFTLIELLVVIAIIGLLSTLAVVSLNNARSKARDAKRTSDIKTIQTAMDLYRVDHNDAIFALPATWADFSTALADYLPGGMPVDPNISTTVYNVCIDGDKYVIAGVLENTPPAPGLAAISDYQATDCRDEVAAQALPACDGATVFCLGDAAGNP